MNNKIKKDDLDALGDMAGLVGTYMKDFASKADAEARSKLFKTDFNVRSTLAKALVCEEDVAQQVIPDGSNVGVDMTPAPQIPSPTVIQPSPTITTNQIIPLTLPQDNGKQLEFGFLDLKIQDYGSVNDVIKHFNSRLDRIEASIREIKSFISDIKNNMPRSRKLVIKV